MQAQQYISIIVLSLILISCQEDHGSNHSANKPESIPISTITYDALYVVNGQDNSISIINTTTNEVGATIQLKNATYPHHIYLSPDRSQILVAILGQDLSEGHSGGHGGTMGQSSIITMEALTGKIREARFFDNPAHNAIMGPDAAGIWITQITTPGKVIVLDPISLANQNIINVGDSPLEVTFTPNGRYVFVANNGSDNVTVIDAETKTTVKTIAVGDGPVGAWPGSNGVMYVDNETGKSLTAIDATTLEIVRTYNLGFTPAMAAVAPDSTLWVTDTDNGKVVIYKTQSDEKIGEITVGSGAHGIAFTGDGSTGYISNQNAGTVSVINVPKRTVIKTITVGKKPNGMVWRKM